MTRIASSTSEPTTKGASPYANRPERATWRCWEIMERPDGSRELRSWTRSRWAGSYSSGPVTTIDVAPDAVKPTLDQWRAWWREEDGQ